MPPIRVLLVEEGPHTGRFGARALGEIATIPVAPAIVNAVNHALGTALTELPLTPQRILGLLRRVSNAARWRSLDVGPIPSATSVPEWALRMRCRSPRASGADGASIR